MTIKRKSDLTYLWPNEEFKQVYEYAYKKDGTVIYEGRIQINKRQYAKLCDTAREAAIHVDKILLQNGKEPINVLKRK